MGVQTCSEDGTRFEECDCNPGAGGNGGSGGSAGSSAGGSSGAAGAPMEAPFTGATGLPCETDTDCFGGLTCLPSTSAENPFGIGGVQRGICTRACAEGEAGSNSCRSVDSASECILFGEDTEGFCLGLCPVGFESPERCGGRIDMACIPAPLVDNTGQIGICRPQCSSDVDCGERLCDLGTGLCVDTLPVRGPGGIGANCTADTEETDCTSGFCLDLEEDSSGFCTAPCVLGSPAGCGFAQGATPRDASCFALGPNAVLGDRGVCVELCDVEADCAQEDYTCTTLSAQSQQTLGRTGRCLPAEEGADAGADGG